MKKLKTIAIIIATIVISSLNIGCTTNNYYNNGNNNGSDNNNSEIVGTWYYTDQIPESTSYCIITYQFDSNGRYIETLKYSDHLDSKGEVQEGEYEYDGEYLTMHWGIDAPIEKSTWKAIISGDTMVWYYESQPTILYRYYQ